MGKSYYMIQLRFKLLEIQNFMSIGTMEVPLDGKGLVLLEGMIKGQETKSNGAGKSSITQALKWVITGLTDRVGSKEEKSLVNRTAGKNTFVRLTTDKIDNGVCSTLVIWRSIKHDKFGNSCGLEVDGVNMSCDNTADTEVRITNMLGLTYGAVSHQIILSQGLTNRFTLLGERERSQLVEDMVERQEFESAYQHSLSSTNLLKKRSESIVSNIGVLNEQIRSHNFSLDALRVRIAEIKVKASSGKEDLTSEITNLRTYFNSLTEFIKAKQGEIAEIQVAVSEYNKLYSNISQQVRALEQSLNAEMVVINQVDRSGNDKSCTLCGAVVDVEALKRKNNYDNRVQAVKALEVDLEGQRIHLKTLDEKTSTLRSNLQIVNDQRSGKSLEQTGVTTRLSVLEQQAAVYDLDVMLEENRVQAINLEVGEKTLAIATKNEELLKVNKSHSLVQYWEEAYSPTGIRSRLKDRVYDLLNEYCHEYLSQMYDDQMSVQVSSTTNLKSGKQNSKTSFQINTPTGESPLGLASGGETRRIDLTFQFALMSVSVAVGAMSSNVLFCDEIMDSLDFEGKTRVIRLLEKISERVGSVFIISQDPTVKSLVRNRWKVIKENDLTRLEIPLIGE